MLMDLLWPVVMLLVWMKFLFYEVPRDVVLILLDR